MKTIEEEAHSRLEQIAPARLPDREELSSASPEDSSSRIIELARSVITLGIKERKREEERARYADIGGTMLGGWTGGDPKAIAAELLSEA